MVESPGGLCLGQLSDEWICTRHGIAAPQPEYMQVGQEGPACEYICRALVEPRLDVDDNAMIREATATGLAASSRELSVSAASRQK